MCATVIPMRKILLSGNDYNFQGSWLRNTADNFTHSSPACLAISSTVKASLQGYNFKVDTSSKKIKTMEAEFYFSDILE